MIRLYRSAPPTELTADEVTRLTNLYLAQGDNVWNKSFIKKKLLDFSFGKCAFCECKANEGSVYVEVEHFLPKKIYPERVVEWENLLPSCKRCNGEKGEHDTGLEQIVNPTLDNPSEHFSLIGCRFHAKTDLGRRTIEVINLNDRARKLPERRFEIYLDFCERLENLREGLNNQLIINRKLQREMRILLVESIPSAEYSATAATTLFSPENKFDEIKQQMMNLQLWDDEMEQLETQARNCCLFA